MRYLHSLKAIPHKILNNKGKKSNFTVEKPSIHPCNHVTKDGRTSNSINQNPASVPRG